ncbi:MAG: glycosyltransferase family 9 protein [Planctomycetota bacterium]|jgi:ADP-heptose:LPS heptosyltransferase
MAERNRCLVLRPGALGDAIVTLPAFELIHREYDGLQAVLAASPPGCRVGELSGLFSATRPYESPELASLFVDGLERNGIFEDVAAMVAFGAAGAGEIAERARAAGVPEAASVDTWPAPDGGHVAEQLLSRTAEALGVDLDEEPLELSGRALPGAGDFSSPEGAPQLPVLEVRPDEEAWSARPGRRLAVAPGAGSLEKCWPASAFVRTCEILSAGHDLHVMLLLGPAEMERPEIRAAFGRIDCTVSECWSVPDLAAALAACDLYLGNDSGLSHLAAWAGVEGIAIFGPTDPALWSPLGHVSTAAMDSLTPELLADTASQLLDWQ